MRPGRVPSARWSALQWVALLALGIVAAVLAHVGLVAHLEAQGKRYGFVDIVFLDLKLFGLADPPGEPPWPWQLEVARFIAPLVCGFSAVKALALVYRDRLDALRRAFARDHVVVVGGGEEGRLAAAAVRAAGRDVVLIDQDPSAPALAELRRRGVLATVGDARRAHTLDLARVDRAQAVIVLCGDDTTNAEVVGAVSRVAKARGSRLRCTAHISDPDLCQLLRLEELSGDASGGIELDFVNLGESAAQLLAARLAADEPGRVLVVGTTPLARRLVAGLTRSATVTPAHLSTAAEVVAAVSAGLDDVTHVVVSGPDDGSTLEAALSIDHAMPDGVRITAVFARPGGLATLATSVTEGGSDRLRPFVVLEPLASPDLLRSSTIERIARAAHEEYQLARDRDQGRASDDAARADWEDLTEDLRDSNRAQARSILGKLRRVGAVAVPDGDLDPAAHPPFSFTADEVEVLARAEHQRWRSEREHAGWRPGARDPRHKQTPYLVDWDDLPDDIRELDRQAVRSIPTLLRRAGFRVARGPTGDQDRCTELPARTPATGPTSPAERRRAEADA